MNRFKTQLLVQIKSVDEATSIIKGVFSTSDEDRQGEIVAPGSWKLENYMNNPVVLWAHDHSELPLGKVISLGYNESQDLEGEIQFAVKENPKAKVVFDLMKGSYLRAFSVGFSSNDVGIDEATGRTILKDNELYEISVVNVPANAMALAKSKGVDVTALEEKEGRVLSTKNRSTIESARDALQAVLDADSDKSISTSDDTNGVKPLGRKPLTKQGVVKAKAVDRINQAVRSMLKAKTDLER